MSGMLISAANVSILQAIHATIAWMGILAAAIGDIGLLQLHLPWVQDTYQTLMGIALSIFSAYLAWIVLSRYLLWSEGTADRDGMVLVKSVFRTMIYFVGSSAMVGLVYRFGLALGARILAGSLTKGLTVIQDPVNMLRNLGSQGVGLMMVVLGLIAVAASIVLLIWILISMFYRSAELVVYFLGAPFAALSQLTPSAGVWEEWWKGLVVMSLAPAVQMLCLRGMEGTVQVVLGVQKYLSAHGSTGMLAHAGNVQIGFVLAVGFDCAWLALGVFGPSLLKQWAYHGGMENIVGVVSRHTTNAVFSKGAAGASVPASGGSQASGSGSQAGNSSPSGEV